MADLGNEFNAEEHKPMESRDPIPPGTYEAMIVESEVKPTKAGDGKVLALRWRIIAGEYENRLIFDNINIDNPNPQAVDIAGRQLADICRAVGKLRVKDSIELHDVPCILTVKIRPEGQDKKGVWRNAQNEIKGYEMPGGLVEQPAATSAPATVTKPAPAAARQPAMAGGGGGKPPWKK